MTPKLQRMQLKVGLYFVTIAIACIVISAAGLAWLYLTDFPPDQHVPKSVIVPLLGSFAYGVLGLFTLSFSSQSQNLAEIWGKAKGQISVTEVGIILTLVLVGVLNA